MKLNYLLSNLAISDLDRIWIYTAEKWSKNQANKYYQDIFSAITQLQKLENQYKKLSQTTGSFQLNHMSLFIKL